MNTELDVDGSVLILDEATVAGAGPSHTMTGGGIETFEAYGTTSDGIGSAIIQIQVSNDGSTWITAGTINLDLKTNRTSDRLTMDSALSKWTYVRSNLKSISGTGASVSVYKNDVLSKGLAAELAAIGVYSAPTAAPMGEQGAGMGVCNPAYVPAGLVGLYGYTDRSSPNFGNYIHPASGSIMCFIPLKWTKWGAGIGVNGLAINQCSIVDDTPSMRAFLSADGYAVDRMFWDGGAVKSGVFVDKYLCSNNAGIAASIKNGNPLSTSAGHNPISGLIGAFPNFHYSAIDAAKARGVGFFCSSRFIFTGLARISYAHGQQSSNTTYCAWWDATNNFPKGCNNDALRDAHDASVLYTSDGYLNCGKTGSGTPFAKTTHNGQECGVADLNGLMWEVTPGITSDGSSFFVLKPTVSMGVLNGGNASASDVWGAASLAANYDNIGATYGALTASSTTKLYGNASQVFSEAQSGNAWNVAGLGIPLLGGVGGTNAFGNDGFYDYRPSEMCALSGGRWSSIATAGVWSLSLPYARGSSIDFSGFRAAIYPTA